MTVVLEDEVLTANVEELNERGDVYLKGSVKANASLREELRQHVGKEIGPVAKPDNIRFADALPKTRSGKIMRRLLKQIAAGNTQVQGDTSTLEDISVIAQLSKDEG